MLYRQKNGLGMFAGKLTVPIVTLVGLSLSGCNDEPPHSVPVPRPSKPLESAPLSYEERLVQLESDMNALNLHLSLIPGTYEKLEINQLRVGINAVAAAGMKFEFQNEEQRLKYAERMKGFNERFEDIERGIK